MLPPTQLASLARYRRALKGKEEALGPAHPGTLFTVGNLARLLLNQAKDDAAEEARRPLDHESEQSRSPMEPTEGQLRQGAVIETGSAAAAAPLVGAKRAASRHH